LGEISTLFADYASGDWPMWGDEGCRLKKNVEDFLPRFISGGGEMVKRRKRRGTKGSQAKRGGEVRTLGVWVICSSDRRTSPAKGRDLKRIFWRVLG